MKNLLVLCMTILMTLNLYAKPADELKAETITGNDFFNEIILKADLENFERLLREGFDSTLIDPDRELHNSPLYYISYYGKTNSKESQEMVIKFYDIATKYGADFHKRASISDDSLIAQAIQSRLTLVFRYLMKKGLGYHNPFDYRLQNDPSESNGLEDMFKSCNIKILKIVYNEYDENKPICEFAKYTRDWCFDAIKNLAPKINQDPKDCFNSKVEQ